MGSGYGAVLSEKSIILTKMKIVGVTLAAIVGYAAAQASAPGDKFGAYGGLSKSACQANDDCKYDRSAADKKDWFCDSKKVAKAGCADEGYACADKSAKCCKKAMKDKEAGRKDEDKCYFDKDAKKCVDHTECEQVTKKGWCKKFFKRAPWSCEWNKQVRNPICRARDLRRKETSRLQGTRRRMRLQ